MRSKNKDRAPRTAITIIKSISPVFAGSNMRRKTVGHKEDNIVTSLIMVLRIIVIL